MHDIVRTKGCRKKIILPANNPMAAGSSLHRGPGIHTDHALREGKEE